MEALTYLVFGGLCAAVAYVIGRDSGERQGRDACEHLGELAEIFRRRGEKMDDVAAVLAVSAENLREHADWLMEEANVMDQMTGQDGDSHE